MSKQISLLSYWMYFLTEFYRRSLNNGIIIYWMSTIMRRRVCQSGERKKRRRKQHFPDISFKKESSWTNVTGKQLISTAERSPQHHTRQNCRSNTKLQIIHAEASELCFVLIFFLHSDVKTCQCHINKCSHVPMLNICGETEKSRRKY